MRHFQLTANWPPERYLFLVTDPGPSYYKVSVLYRIPYTNKRLRYCRENARRATSVEVLSTAACAAVQRIPFGNTLQWVNDLELCSRSSELPLFDRCTYHFLLVICSNNRFCVARFRRFYHICSVRDCHVTFRSPSISIRQLKLQATAYVRFPTTRV